jgi:hypothetical protein
MPRFYFHIRNGNGYTPDEEGQDLADLREARAIALAGIRSLLGEELAAGSLDLDGRIDIADDAGKLLLSLLFADAVDIHFRAGGT